MSKSVASENACILGNGRSPERPTCHLQFMSLSCLASNGSSLSLKSLPFLAETIEPFMPAFVLKRRGISKRVMPNLTPGRRTGSGCQGYCEILGNWRGTVYKTYDMSYRGPAGCGAKIFSGVERDVHPTVILGKGRRPWIEVSYSPLDDRGDLELWHESSPRNRNQTFNGSREFQREVLAYLKEHGPEPYDVLYVRWLR